MFEPPKRYIVISLLAITVVWLSVLYAPKSVEQQPQKKPAEASLRLAWIPQGTFAGDYVAVKDGLWNTEEIIIEVNPGGFEYDSIKLVAASEDTFGIASGPELIEARARGVPLVAIGVVIPDSPIVWVSKAGSGIKEPKDFLGKRVGAQFGTHTEITFETLFDKLDLSIEEVSRIPMKYDYTPFISDALDVVPVYIIDQVVEFRRNGIEVNIIDPRDYGVDLGPGNLYFTSEETLENEPELVRHFLRGAAKGWQRAYDDPSYAAAAILPHTGGGSEEGLKMQIDAITEFVSKSGAIGGVEKIDEKQWQDTIAILSESGRLENVDAVEGGYTNEHLPH